MLSDAVPCQLWFLPPRFFFKFLHDLFTYITCFFVYISRVKFKYLSESSGPAARACEIIVWLQYRDTHSLRWSKLIIKNCTSYLHFSTIWSIHHQCLGISVLLLDWTYSLSDLGDTKPLTDLNQLIHRMYWDLAI